MNHAQNILRTRPSRTKVVVALATLAATIPVTAWNVAARRDGVQAASVASAAARTAVDNPIEARRRADFAAMQKIGLAQVFLESGMSGTRRSEANAVGFCQWLQRNWKRLNYFSPVPIEGQNQTTQAPYCAAYLSVLATKYGSFIPAVSEHNAGGTNVGRTLINGEHLGADDVRAQYLMGSKLANDLRALPGREYASVYLSYGPRSHLYAEMVFGNTFNVRNLARQRHRSLSTRCGHRARSLLPRSSSERICLQVRCGGSIRH